MTRPNKTKPVLAALGLAALGLAAGFATVAPAQAQSPVQIGLLTCQVDGATGKILGSKRELSCIFENADSTARPVERYAGEITRIGLDIGKTQYSDIGWGVFAVKDNGGQPGALEGTYAGISAGVSLGAGIGANALIGGLNRSIALQPLSVETTSGVNLALGIAQLTLISVDSFSN